MRTWVNVTQELIRIAFNYNMYWNFEFTCITVVVIQILPATFYLFLFSLSSFIAMEPKKKFFFRLNFDRNSNKVNEHTFVPRLRCHWTFGFYFPLLLFFASSSIRMEPKERTSVLQNISIYVTRRYITLVLAELRIRCGKRMHVRKAHKAEVQKRQLKASRYNSNNENKKRNVRSSKPKSKTMSTTTHHNTNLESNDEKRTKKGRRWEPFILPYEKSSRSSLSLSLFLLLFRCFCCRSLFSVLFVFLCSYSVQHRVCSFAEWNDSHSHLLVK